MTSWNDRSAERRTVQLVTPYVDTRSGRFITGRTRDLSLAGVFIEAAEYPPVGTLVDLFIGGIGVGAQVLGRVVREAGDGFGVRFTGDTTVLGRLLA
jgi:hypothetical protein